MLSPSLAASSIRVNTSPAGAEQSTPPEHTVWTGRPSQLINFPYYAGWTAVLVALIVIGVVTFKPMDVVPSAVLLLYVVALLIPLALMVWRWLVTANTTYELTTQRLRTRTGVLNKHLNELELYRVRDYRMEQPFFLRLFALSVLKLTTSDRTHPLIEMRAVPRGDELREQMRTFVEEARMRRGVRELDLEL